jgi:hypothetical protein
MDDSSDQLLRDAWERFLGEMRAAGDAIFAEGLPTSPQERAEAFRYLCQGVSIGFEFFVENADTEFPYLMRYFDPTHKQAGDNQDSLILGAWIDGSRTYRIVGNRGTVKWVVFSVLREPEPGDDLFGISQMGPPYNLVRDAEPLLGPDLEVEWDGSFTVILSPEEHAGNWIKTTPKSRHLRVREFHGQWDREESMRLRIERVGASGAPSLLTPEAFVERLEQAGAFVRRSTEYWGPQTTRLGVPVNQMVALRPEQSPGYIPAGGSLIGKLDANPGGVNGRCHWRLGPDEALIIEFRPTLAFFWSFELDNPWYATMDYRWRLSGLNSEQAVLEEDGSVRVVLAHQDPGVPNWLDASGWSEGSINYRGLLSSQPPEFRSRLVKLSELAHELPARGRMITPDERQRQMRQQQTGVARRFPV